MAVAAGRCRCGPVAAARQARRREGCRGRCIGGGGDGNMARAVMARGRRWWRRRRRYGGSEGAGGAWGRRRRASWCEVAARPAVASAMMARAEDVRAVGMAAAGLATAATVPVSMVAASQRWQGRRWRRWCWRERRQREESRCPAWPHPRQPPPRHPSALGTRRHPTRRQKRPPSRHRRPVPPTSGWRCGYRAWQGAAKSVSTPRVGRLPPADTDHPLGPCGRLRGVRPPENSFALPLARQPHRRAIAACGNQGFDATRSADQYQ